jgi:hypothetical protein
VSTALTLAPAGRWRIWIRHESDLRWIEPLIAGPGANVGWDCKEDAEMITASFRDFASCGAESDELSLGAPRHPRPPDQILQSVGESRAAPAVTASLVGPTDRTAGFS